MSGVLEGIRVIEIGGLGPAPFAAMMLADHGAEVIRVDRPDKVPDAVGGSRPGLSAFDILNRNRPSVAIDLKSREGVDLLLDLADTADVLIEGFRPGVVERLGFGPDIATERNPKLIYARMTGWGQTGPLAPRAGHDINYISVAGAQAHIGRVGQPPTPPLNLVGDFGGGGMMLAFGICAALVNRSMTGHGQVIDAAMIDGSALLMAPLIGAHESGFWSDERGTNMLDSGAPYYDCYQCADGAWISVGALEPQFFAALLSGLGLNADDVPAQHDASRADELRAIFADKFASQPRQRWIDRFADIDACVSPVLTMGEVSTHPHVAARQTMVTVDGATHPAPAPRFSRTPAPSPTTAPSPGADTASALQRWGISAERIDELMATGAIK